MSLVLSQAKFIAWLNSKHPRTKAGVACDATSCPLAKFLTQTTGVPYDVDGVYYGPVDQDGEITESKALPQWAQEFVNAVDDSEHESVSVMRALTIVENSNIGRGRVSRF